VIWKHPNGSDALLFKFAQATFMQGVSMQSVPTGASLSLTHMPTLLQLDESVHAFLSSHVVLAAFGV